MEIVGEKVKAFSAGVLAGLLLSYLISRAPIALDYWRVQAPVREAGRQAEKLGLSYESVWKNLQAAAGKPVKWS